MNGFNEDEPVFGVEEKVPFEKLSSTNSPSIAELSLSHFHLDTMPLAFQLSVKSSHVKSKMYAKRKKLLFFEAIAGPKL